ncbi:MAG: hypothetical protein O3C60_09690 [Planctomycetota bacterium]|nr:hypothetical protein [Planctomycetota bacterium]
MSISRAYLPWLRSDARTAILGTLPIEYYAEWTFIARYPERQRPATTQQTRWFGVVHADNERNFAAWVQAYHPDQILLIDVHDGSPVGFPDFDHFRQFRDLLPSQGSYHRVRQDVLQGLGCTVSLWEPAIGSRTLP